MASRGVPHYQANQADRGARAKRCMIKNAAKPTADNRLKAIKGLNHNQAKAIVTGATRGIGRAIAHSLANEGADVAICARTESGVADTVNSLRALGVRAFGAALDVRDRDAFISWHAAASAELGGIDIAI